MVATEMGTRGGEGQEGDVGEKGCRSGSFSGGASG